MWRRPLLEVRNVSTGKDIMPQLKGLWTNVTITDNDGKESDTAEITCIYRKGMALPAKGDAYDVFMGWADEGLVLQGRFTVQKISRNGSPQEGHKLVIQLRAADYVDRLKAESTQHYDEGTTFGSLMDDLGKQAGLEVVVPAGLRQVKLGYRLRYQQSPIDFAAEVAEELGAGVKPAGGKLIVTARGEGQSASGRDLDVIEIRYRRAYSYDIEIEPRPAVGKVAAAWQDPDTGKRRYTKEDTGMDGPIRVLDHPYRSEDEAKQAAKAEAREQAFNTGEGYFLCPGLPKARAGATIVASGFGEPIDGNWKADSVEKTINADEGFHTTVNITSDKKGKGKKKGKGGSSAPGPNDSQLPH